MSAFESPNYTQTPNDFFKMLPEMESSEVRVTLVMIRETFGWHRQSFKMGIDELAAAAGLSRNAAKDGAEAAEKRGTFRRTNPDAKTKAEWELAVDDGQPVTIDGQPVTIQWSTSDPQVGIKERKETNKTNSTTTTPAPIFTQNCFTVYEQNIGALTPMIADQIKELEAEYGPAWFCQAVREAVSNEARNLRYVTAILKRWKVEGFQSRKQQKPRPAPKPTQDVPRGFTAAQEWLKQRQEATNG